MIQSTTNPSNNLSSLEPMSGRRFNRTILSFIRNKIDEHKIDRLNFRRFTTTKTKPVTPNQLVFKQTNASLVK